MTDSAVLAERAALEQEVAGRTLCDALAATADSFGELPAYSDREGPPARGRRSPGRRPGRSRSTWPPG